MELNNTTDEDTKYKVSGTGGGSGMAPHSPFSFEDARHWPTLPAGGQIKHRPNSPGPWTVYFVVNGHGIFRKVDSDDGRVTLVETGGGFRVDIN